MCQKLWEGVGVVFSLSESWEDSKITNVPQKLRQRGKAFIESEGSAEITNGRKPGESACRSLGEFPSILSGEWALVQTWAPDRCSTVVKQFPGSWTVMLKQAACRMYVGHTRLLFLLNLGMMCLPICTVF